MSPADTSTLLTAMTQAQKLTNSTGQIYTIFTNDQQLYCIVVDIMWVYTKQFVNFIPRLGGMHTLMSFVGAVGNLMADKGLESIMEVAFGGVAKMPSGKKVSPEGESTPANCRGITPDSHKQRYSVLPGCYERTTTQSLPRPYL